LAIHPRVLVPGEIPQSTQRNLKRQLFACEQSYLISYTWRHGAQHDETLPLINKPKHPKEGRIHGTKWKDPRPRRHMKILIL